MPKPSTQLSRSRPDIAESMVEFDLQANNNKMIATQLLPVFEANAQAGNFGRIPLESLLEESKTDRASGGSYGRGDYEFEDVFFATKEQGWEEPVDDRDAKIYADYFDAEMIAADRAQSKILVNQEKRAAAITFGNGSINTTAAGTVWSTAASATPVTNVETAVQAVWARTGLWPNAIVMSYLLFRELRQCSEVLDRIESSGAGDQTRASDVTTAQLAAVFDLDHVLIAGGSRNTAKKGQTASVAQIWDKTKCMVATVATGQDLREPCIGRTFHWSEDGSSIGGTVESYRAEDLRSEIIRCRHETQEKLIYPEAAEIITGCLA